MTDENWHNISVVKNDDDLFEIDVENDFGCSSVELSKTEFEEFVNDCVKVLYGVE